MSERLYRYHALLRARASAPVLTLLPAVASARDLHEQQVDHEYVNAPRFGEQFEMRPQLVQAAPRFSLMQVKRFLIASDVDMEAQCAT